MTVQPPASEVTPDAIIRAVARTGMRAEVWRDATRAAAEDGFWQRHGRTITTIVSGLLVLIGFVVHVVLAGGIWAAIGSEGLGVVHHVPLAARIPYLLAILTAFWHIVPKAWRAARRLRPDMNLLMTVAVVGAIGIGEWFEAATVAFLFALSLALESWSVGRARRAVAALMELAPPIARLKKPDGTEEQVPPEQVPVGAHFVVMPGEKFPLDGQRCQRLQRGQPGPDYRRERTRAQTARRPGVCRNDQWGWCPGSGMHETGQRHHPGPYHPHGCRGPVAPRPLGAMGREVRPRLHAGRDGACRRLPGRPAAFLRRRLGRLVLSVAGAAGHRLSLRPGDLHAGEHRGGLGRLGAQRSAHQGRNLRGGPGEVAGNRARQDGNLDRRKAPRLGGCAAERAR